MRAKVLIDDLAGFVRPKVITAEIKKKAFEIGGEKFYLPVALVGEARFLVVEAFKLKELGKTGDFEFYAIAQVPVITWEGYGCDGKNIWSDCNEYDWVAGLNRFILNMRRLSIGIVIKSMKENIKESGDVGKRDEQVGDTQR